jgi:predicted amidohydrolase
MPATDPHTAIPDSLRVAVAQTWPVLRDPGENVSRIATLAGAHDCDLLVTPELSLTGYDLGDSVSALAVPLSRSPVPNALRALSRPRGQIVVGLPEQAHGGPFNTAIAVGTDGIAFRHRKLYLPTYGMFDEGRWYGRGSRLRSWHPAPGWHAGVLICEDLWHPALTWLLAGRGIDLLLVQAAAPGRGVATGGEHGAFASADIWERIIRTTAQLYGIYVAYANRVGVEGAVTFAGGSLIVAPDGAVLARADDTAEVFLEAELTRAALAAARRPYSHARDDDAHLVLRELRRTLRHRTPGDRRPRHRSPPRSRPVPPAP